MVERVAQILGIDSKYVKELLKYIDLSEDDYQRLRKLKDMLTSHELESVFTKFYEYLREHEATRKIIEREGISIDRLRDKQVKHLKEMLGGSYDLEYALRRLHVGIVHEKENVKPIHYIGAFSKWYELVLELLKGRVPDDEVPRYMLALFKAIMFDMVLSMEAYYFIKVIKNSDSRYRALINSMPDGVVLVDTETRRIVDMNRAFAELIEAEEEQIEEVEIYRVFPKELEDLLKKKCEEFINTGKGFSEIIHVESWKSGEWIPVEVKLGKYVQEGKTYALLIFRDIREKLRKEEKLRRLNKLYHALSGINTLVTSVNDRDKLFVEAVNILATRGGFKHAGIYRKDSDKAIAESGDVSDTDTAVCIELQEVDDMYLKVSRQEAGSFLPEEIELLKEVAYDISFGINRIESERRISHLILHDGLTGLPNRAYFMYKLNEVMDLASRRDTQIGLLTIDIDHFKELNEALGHTRADELLRKVANRLREVVRSSDFLARVGGDEFGLIVVADKAGQAIDKLLSRLVKAFSEPFSIGEHRIYVTFSVGGSIYPEDVRSSEVLYTNALASMERAKSLGGNRLVMYSSEISKATEEKIRLRASLRKALERGEFELYYQPKVSTSTGKVVGAEALIRWIRNGEVIPPGKFLPTLEEGELIHEVGNWVLEEVCRQLYNWNKEGLSIRVAINVSPVQIKVPAFVDDMLNLVAKCGDISGQLEVEITETAVMDDVAASIELIESLNRQGIKTYIDDFGTGHSSLAYLKKLPVSGLKIDREFIKDTPEDREDVEIVKASILLAKTFGLETVAEGVETSKQFDFLRELGCDYAQGFFIAKPMPADRFLEFVRKQGY